MNERETAAAISFLIRVGVIVSAIIAITVIAVPIFAPMISPTYAIPPQIKEWGGVIIGFYFGSFITLIGNLLKTSVDGSKGPDEAAQAEGAAVPAAPVVEGNNPEAADGNAPAAVETPRAA